MDNGPELVSQALQRFCENKVGPSYIPPGTPWNNGYIESFNNRLRKECLNRNHWNTLFEARVVIGDFKKEHNHRHAIRPWATGRRPSTLRRAGAPTPRWLRDQLNPEQKSRL
jgi:transposase InsO family protein